MAKKKEVTIRSSAAEYLTFITATGEGGVEAVYADENVWLTQKMMGVLYNVGTNTINYHLHKLYEDGEIEEDSVIRKFRITANDGKEYNTMHYNLKAIIAVGNKVDSPKAVQFRKWANTIIEEYTVKGYAMDDERLKKGGSILTKEYFEQLLERIREIRLSERKFYQKITDIYATSIDYDSTTKETRRFFAAVRNKLHYAVHGHTAAMEEKMATVLNEMSEYLSISQLIVPPIDLQKQFMTFVKQVDKSKVAVQKSLDETQKLFDSLMQEYYG